MASELHIAGTPAEIYEQHMVPAIFARWAPDLVEAAEVRPGGHVLDVACGTGGHQGPVRAGCQVHLRVDAKTIRFHSAEHVARAVVGGAPTMLGALAEQGEGVLDAIAAEVTQATRAYVDDEGWATPSISHVVTAVA